MVVLDLGYTLEETTETDYGLLVEVVLHQKRKVDLTTTNFVYKPL